MPCSFCGGYRNVKSVRVEGKATMALCALCWGIYRETGQRPPRYRMRDPNAGPITGSPLRLKP